MNTYNYNFQYNPKNLEIIKFDLFNWNVNLEIIYLIFWLFIFFLSIYLVLPYIKTYFEIINKIRDDEKKRETLSTLSLMKDVQDELDKEIEESILNAWLRSSSVSV